MAKKENKGSKSKLEHLDRQFKEAIMQDHFDDSLLSQLIKQLHGSKEPEWKKVRVKDDWIKAYINLLDRDLTSADWMPRGTHRMFRHVLGALKYIEALNEEIKDELWPEPKRVG